MLTCLHHKSETVKRELVLTDTDTDEFEIQ